MKTKTAATVRYIGIAAAVIALSIANAGCSSQAGQTAQPNPAFSTESGMKAALSTRSAPPADFMAAAAKISGPVAPKAPPHP
jgi:hypothetical protein